MMLKTYLLAAITASSAVSYAARPVPRAALLERLTAEDDVIGIVHWGLNTYTDREWGYGDEDPRMLDPKSFDADQIVGACKAAGMKGLVVVAKHHDGFCLWPTKTTEHNITKSPFRGGKGDYVREMADACRRAGLRFGVYVSPWDRNSSHYATGKYTEIFHAQIKELLGGAYGEVFEMWFDGANGGDGWYGGAKERRKIGVAGEYYRFDEVFRFVRELQPKVTIFAGENDDSDFRWPGNERGFLDPDSRATVTPCGGFSNGKYGNPAYRGEINTGSAGGTCFRVCEADFPLRKGWFYHEKERGTTKSAAYLTRLYIGTVGNGGIMNIGVSPTGDGVLCADDVRELRGFGEMKAALFRQEVTEDGKPFNMVEMREDIRYGEQVDGWKIVADGRELLSGKSIGYRRIRLLPEPVSPAKCTLEITASGPAVRPVKFRRYFVDPELVKKILSATGDTGETETAKKMSQAASAPALLPSGKRVGIWPKGKMPSPQANQAAPFLVWHTPEKLTSRAILIAVSGGAYVGNTVGGCEVVPIRDYFLKKGVTVVTMKYRVPRPVGLPKHVTAWQDAQRTVRLVRAEAIRRGLDPEKIGFTGCSAGGHLALMVATSSQTRSYEPVDEIDSVPCHVNWAIPVYPAYGLVPNAETAEKKGCDDLSAPLVPEFAFDSKTPPMCLVHGDADVWSAMVSVRVYHKLRTMNIPAELHVMALENHCFMDDSVDGTPAATWKDRVWEWGWKFRFFSNHPVSYNWRDPIRGRLENAADFEKDVWRRSWIGVLTAEKDSALWLKGEYSDFVLDLEYRLDPGANSGVIIYASDVEKWIPNSVEIQLLDDHAPKWKNEPPRSKNGSIYGHAGPAESSSRPAGLWNRMTIWARGNRVKVMVNERITVDEDLSRYTSAKINPDGTPIPPWLSNPLADLPKRGAIGFQGRHGGARPYFRNVRIRSLEKNENF